jgi:hypothetical protein
MKRFKLPMVFALIIIASTAHATEAPKPEPTKEKPAFSLSGWVQEMVATLSGTGTGKKP